MIKQEEVKANDKFAIIKGPYRTGISPQSLENQRKYDPSATAYRVDIYDFKTKQYSSRSCHHNTSKGLYFTKGTRNYISDFNKRFIHVPLQFIPLVKK